MSDARILQDFMLYVWMPGEGAWTEYWPITAPTRADATRKIPSVLQGTYKERFIGGGLRWKLAPLDPKRFQ